MKIYKNTNGMTRFFIVVIDIICCFLGFVLFNCLEDFYQYHIRIGKHPLEYLVISIMGNVLMYMLYFVYIPTKWKKQTVGRALFRSKVVFENNYDCDFTAFVFRELIGNIVLYSLNCLCLLGFIFQILLLRRESTTTLNDKIARTKMINLKEIDTTKTNAPKNYSKKKTSFWDILK